MEEIHNHPDWSYIHMTVILTFEWMESKGIPDRTIECQGFQIRLTLEDDPQYPGNTRRTVRQTNGPHAP